MGIIVTVKRWTWTIEFQGGAIRITQGSIRQRARTYWTSCGLWQRAKQPTPATYCRICPSYDLRHTCDHFREIRMVSSAASNSPRRSFRTARQALKSALTILVDKSVALLSSTLSQQDFPLHVDQQSHARNTNQHWSQ